MLEILLITIAILVIFFLVIYIGKTSSKGNIREPPIDTPSGQGRRVIVVEKGENISIGDLSHFSDLNIDADTILSTGKNKIKLKTTNYEYFKKNEQ